MGFREISQRGGETIRALFLKGCVGVFLLHCGSGVCSVCFCFEVFFFFLSRNISKRRGEVVFFNKTTLHSSNNIFLQIFFFVFLKL